MCYGGGWLCIMGGGWSCVMGGGWSCHEKWMKKKMKIGRTKNVMEEAGRGRKHEGWLEWGRCVLPHKVICWR